MDPCLLATIQLSFTTLLDMTYVVAEPATSQTFALGTDSKSVLFGIPGYCGPLEYSIVEGHTFASVQAAADPGTISVQTAYLADVRIYTATFDVKLTNYPTATAAQVTFTI